MNKKRIRHNINESIADVAKDDVGNTEKPAYAAAVRDLKKANKTREEARKLKETPKRDEKPKRPKMVASAKKMHLDESLFENTLNNNKKYIDIINNYIVEPDPDNRYDFINDIEDQLDQLVEEDTITEEERDYISTNWDDLVDYTFLKDWPDNFEDDDDDDFYDNDDDEDLDESLTESTSETKDISHLIFDKRYGNKRIAELDIASLNDIDNYFKLIRTIEEAERFNYHSDYWGYDEDYQEQNVDLITALSPYIDKLVTIEYDDGEIQGKLLGIAIDKQYNSINHTKVILDSIKELDESLKLNESYSKAKKMKLDESLFEEVGVRGSYNKPKKSKLSYYSIVDELEKRGYSISGLGEISKFKEENLQKAKDWLDSMGIEYKVTYEGYPKKYYLKVHFPEERYAESVDIYKTEDEAIKSAVLQELEQIVKSKPEGALEAPTRQQVDICKEWFANKGYKVEVSGTNEGTYHIEYYK